MKNKTIDKYLELLKSTILNSIYYPNQAVFEGKDCGPQFPVLSMIGKKKVGQH